VSTDDRIAAIEQAPDADHWLGATEDDRKRARRMWLDARYADPADPPEVEDVIAAALAEGRDRLRADLLALAKTTRSAPAANSKRATGPPSATPPITSAHSSPPKTTEGATPPHPRRPHDRDPVLVSDPCPLHRARVPLRLPRRGDVVIPEEARDLDTAYDLIVAAADDNELWDAIATALIEARNEGRCQPAAEETA
jgi:hypothetical protein